MIRVIEKDDGTHKPRGWVNWFSKQNEFLKLELQKLLLHGSYHKNLINQT